MKVVIDRQIVQLLCEKPNAFSGHPALAHPIKLNWPSFLEYLGVGDLFLQLSPFDETSPLFVASVSTLCSSEEKEVLYYVYDRLFAEILAQIKNLPQVDAQFFLQALRSKRAEGPLAFAALPYEQAFSERTTSTMHDLVLYLAWDRMCVALARLFSYATANSKYIQGLEGLKECLIESYQHIRADGRTMPSFYRMAEALFFFFMREENLQTHTEAEWEVLTQSFVLIQDASELVDVSYIDEAVVAKDCFCPEVCFFTADSRVKSRLALAQLILKKMGNQYFLMRAEIFGIAEGLPIEPNNGIDERDQ